jgi:hypothetical protein
MRCDRKEQAGVEHSDDLLAQNITFFFFSGSRIATNFSQTEAATATYSRCNALWEHSDDLLSQNITFYFFSGVMFNVQNRDGARMALSKEHIFRWESMPYNSHLLSSIRLVLEKEISSTSRCNALWERRLHEASSPPNSKNLSEARRRPQTRLVNLYRIDTATPPAECHVGTKCTKLISVISAYTRDFSCTS